MYHMVLRNHIIDQQPKLRHKQPPTNIQSFGRPNLTGTLDRDKNLRRLLERINV